MFLLDSILLIYIAAAVLPALFLMRFIYRQDRIEPEPSGLLLSLVLKGVLAALCSIVLESIGEAVLNGFVSEDDPKYSIILAFLIVAVVEEGTKFFFLYRRTWNDPNFNYRFDGVVYAAFVSLGFAAFENIGYVFRFGILVSPTRALLAVPGHLGFSVFMGTFYGRAKVCEASGNESGKRANLAAAYLSAVFLHGFYDACAMIGSNLSTGLFVLFVIVMYIVCYRLIRYDAGTDGPV